MSTHPTHPLYLRGAALAYNVEYGGDEAAATEALLRLYDGWTRSEARYFLRYWVAAAAAKGEEYLHRHLLGRPPRVPDYLAVICSDWCQEGHMVDGRQVAFTSFEEVSSAVYIEGGQGWAPQNSACACTHLTYASQSSNPQLQLLLCCRHVGCTPSWPVCATSTRSALLTWSGGCAMWITATAWCTPT